jgi:hypothetical protein
MDCLGFIFIVLKHNKKGWRDEIPNFYSQVSRQEKIFSFVFGY